MTIVNELNKLAEKITGTNPKATTDKKVLDYIADYYAQDDLKPTTNAQAVKNITDSYVSGITPTGTIEISENGTYDVTNKASAEVNVSGPDYYVKAGTSLSEQGYRILADQLLSNIDSCLVDDTKIDYLLNYNQNTKIPAFYSTKKITSGISAFNSCAALKIDLSGITWADSNINCQYMFNGCMTSIIDISSLDFHNVTNTTNMFHYAGANSEKSDGSYEDGIPYVYVKDAYAQTTAINLYNSGDEYYTWTTDNVVIKS